MVGPVVFLVGFSGNSVVQTVRVEVVLDLNHHILVVSVAELTVSLDDVCDVGVSLLDKSH